MNKNINNKIEELELEKLIWGLFIVGSILSIVADDYQEKYLKNNDISSLNKGYDINVFVLILSIILNSYFVIRNYNDLKKGYKNNKNADLLLVRFIGSVLFIVGLFCTLYFVLNSKGSIGSPDSE